MSGVPLAASRRRGLSTPAESRCTLVWAHDLASSRAHEDELGLFDWSVVDAVARVVRYDARGHGRSEAMQFYDKAFRWPAMVDDMLRAPGEGPFVAGGLAMGGAVALWTALRAPRRVQALVLAIPPPAWENRAAEAARYEEAARTVEEHGLDGVVAVHSLSKRSNLAGYRAGFVAGDAGVVAELLEVRKHAGMIVPAPVQAAMTAALADDSHVAAQREVYRTRRSVLLPALNAAGFRVDESGAGLYLWATRGEDCWTTVAWLAERGVLVAPGSFYGAAGEQHVRVALTGTDERVAAVADRLAV